MSKEAYFLAHNSTAATGNTLDSVASELDPEHRDEFHNSVAKDKDEVDLLIMIGSSLKVADLSQKISNQHVV